MAIPHSCFIASLMEKGEGSLETSKVSDFKRFIPDKKFSLEELSIVGN
jgi:hypothetical protein